MRAVASLCGSENVHAFEKASLLPSADVRGAATVAKPQERRNLGLRRRRLWATAVP
jgi:hypothetical protein